MTRCPIATPHNFEVNKPTSISSITPISIKQASIYMCHGVQVYKMLERRLWMTGHPLRQFPTLLEEHYVRALESRDLTVEKLVDMTPSVRFVFWASVAPPNERTFFVLLFLLCFAVPCTC
jgi:hypothetical protein